MSIKNCLENCFTGPPGCTLLTPVVLPSPAPVTELHTSLTILISVQFCPTNSLLCSLLKGLALYTVTLNDIANYLTAASASWAPLTTCRTIKTIKNLLKPGRVRSPKLATVHSIPSFQPWLAETHNKQYKPYITDAGPLSSLELPARIDAGVV